MGVEVPKLTPELLAKMTSPTREAGAMRIVSVKSSRMEGISSSQPTLHSPLDRQYTNMLSSGLLRLAHASKLAPDMETLLSAEKLCGKGP